MTLSDKLSHKFTSSIPVSDWEVLTDSGWVDVTHSNKTVPYQVYIVITATGRMIKCADDHILFESDYSEMFAKNCQGKLILTEDGAELVTSVVATDVWEEMYDLTVGENHRYYTDGFLSHNTTVMAAILCHYVLFNKQKTCAILANKAATAREILGRVQTAYEHLPKWMQQGVVEWNKGSFSLENGSRILTAGTSSSAIRGFSINFCVAGDTRVTVKSKSYEITLPIREAINLQDATQILGPNGFVPFYGFVSNGIKKTITLRFESGERLTCTENHRLLVGSSWVDANKICVGDILSTGEILESIEDSGREEVFDAVNVGDDSAYLTNSVISHNCLMDEVAFLPPGIAEEFFTSVYPTISSGKTSKLAMISTPNGMNMFYRYWMEALNGTNGFIPIKAIWSDIPGRDEKWADEQKAVLGPVKFRQEMCVAGETKVTVRRVETGEIKELTIQELDEAPIELSHEILTPSGFQPFDGVSKKCSQETHRIVFLDGSDLIATPDHILVDGRKEFSVDSLIASDVIFGKTILYIEPYGKRDVYDPINVAGGNVYYSNGIVSHNCVEFIGSENTLISGEYISALAISTPIHKTPTINVYHPPEPGKHYVMTVDTARGTGGDYSAFVVIDVTSLPYKVAAVYRDNKISSYIYPNVVFEWARKYNEAYVYIELNDIGESIATTLYYDMEYENLVMSSDKGTISSFGGKIPGVRTTHRSKIMGCDSLKQLIEGGKLEVNDPQLILEISNFARKGRSFEAANGNDDLVMCLVMFGYLLTQPLMEELTSDGAKQRIIQEKLKAMDEDLLPAMIFSDGTESLNDGWVDV